MPGHFETDATDALLAIISHAMEDKNKRPAENWNFRSITPSQAAIQMSNKRGRPSSQVLPDPYPNSTGPRKVSFGESLFFITGSHKEGVSWFREWLRDDKRWSEDQIDVFLASRTDHYPPMRGSEMQSLFSRGWVLFPELWPMVEKILSHPAADALLAAWGVNGYFGDWLDYGGFLAAELPTLRSAYRAWKYGENSLQWHQNLHGSGAKKAKVIKIAKS